MELLTQIHYLGSLLKDSALSSVGEMQRPATGAMLETLSLAS